MDFTKLFSLEGKVALITGGSRGIGKMLLEGYLAAGCERVYITARKREQIAETVAEFEAQYPGKVIGLPGDLSQMEDVKRLAQELAAVTVKEYALQDANTLEATQKMLETRTVTEFPLCDQEILLRHLHKMAVDHVEEYRNASVAG